MLQLELFNPRPKENHSTAHSIMSKFLEDTKGMGPFCSTSLLMCGSQMI